MFTHILFTRHPFTRQRPRWPGLGAAAATGRAGMIRVRQMSAPAAEAEATGGARQPRFATVKTLDLSDLTIAGGSVIVIDTARMTVTKDNVNAQFGLADGSKFFYLAPGDTITVNGSGKAMVTVLWKDRWT